ncbi:transducin beta-like protein 3 [Mya arenaria]|uniref:transducin beta-like protein 3 n=1 Tax=Mya arenaria TaxID=6604 RepID=UPI0022DEE6F4|nr:transducin beta-like protein 3 [Mya arenaria]
MSQLKTNFAVKSKYEAFYTGGKIQISKDGLYLFCGCGNKVNVLEISTGKVTITIGEEQEEEITSFCLSPDDQFLILATKHLLLRQWDWRNKKLIRSWKAIHYAPVVCMGFDSTSTLLATGGADSTVKLWDIHKQYCTHNLKGHQGIVSAVAFHPDTSRLQLFTAGEDYKVRAWDLTTSRCTAVIGAHYSLVTTISFGHDGKSVYTAGRDGVVAKIDTSSLSVIRTIPVFEVLEALVVLPPDCDYPDVNIDSGSDHFITAGNKGALRVWNAETGKCVYTTDPVHATQQSETPAITDKQGDDGQNITQLLYNEAMNTITVVTYFQNISILGLDKLRLQKQFAGNNDEILDVKYFGEGDGYAIVATNSQHIKVFELETWNCEILYGHTDIVLAIAHIDKTDMFISSGKDNTVRVWQINPEVKQVSCLAVGQGHTGAVGALAMSRLKAGFFVTGSEDSTLKVWQLPSDLSTTVTMEIQATMTEKAHEKTISSVCIAPNDKFIATGSMDKTAKIWAASDLRLLGVMRGHKRGIWSVQFSPIDQILATSSGDGLVKLWSLTDFSCVRTFEGHDCAVLKVSFVTRGMQLLTSGTNGLVKLWTIKTNECVRTLEEHEDKVWSLAVGEKEDTFITGAADASLIVWQDVTETEQIEAREKQEQAVLQEQELSNLIQQKKYLKAIGLCITLEQPFRLLNILKEIMSGDDGEEKLQETLEKLRMDQIDALLRFSGQWNTNSRHCHEAQVVVSCVLKMYPPAKLQQLANLRVSLEGLIPYSERHLSRMSRLLQQSMFLEYTWQCMKGMDTDKVQSSVELDTAAAIPGIQSENKGSKTGMVDSEETSESEESDLGEEIAAGGTHLEASKERLSSKQDSDSGSDSSSESGSDSDNPGVSISQQNKMKTSNNKKTVRHDSVSESDTSPESDLDTQDRTVESGSSDSDDSEESEGQRVESRIFSTEMVQKKLFKEQLTKENRSPVKNILFDTPMEIGKNPNKKRKITDQFTVVKDHTRENGGAFTIDRKAGQPEVGRGRGLGNKKRKVTRDDKLKKLKGPARR